MRTLFSFFTLGLVVLLSAGLAAQTNYANTVASYVREHDARVSTANSALLEYAPVTLRRNENNELEAFIDNEEQLRIVLQRDTDSDMDYLLPRIITAGVVIITNETVIIIDQAEQIHFAFSLFDEPKLPELKAEPIIVFPGYGISRHGGKGGGAAIDD